MFDNIDRDGHVKFINIRDALSIQLDERCCWQLNCRVLEARNEDFAPDESRVRKFCCYTAKNIAGSTTYFEKG